MTPLRKKIAQRLVQAQHTAAILTTFNEVDMSFMMALRNKFKAEFEEVHETRLGFMSFFSKAVVAALRKYPLINAQIEGDEIVQYEDINLGIAVGTAKRPDGASAETSPRHELCRHRRRHSRLCEKSP